MSVAADIADKFFVPLETFVTQSVSNLASALEGPLMMGAFLYFVIFGIMILLGYVRAPISDFVANSLKVAIIVTLVTNVDNFNYFVQDLFFTQLPEGLSQAIGRVPGSTTTAEDLNNGTAFDTVIDQIILVGDEMIEQASWRDWYPMFVGFIFTVLGTVVTILMFALILLAKTALALTLALGPLFIALVLFRVTQPFFSSWLSVVVNFVLLQVLVVALVTLLMTIVRQYVDDASGKDPGTQIVMAYRLCGVFILSVLMAVFLPSIAARISGGGLALGGGIMATALQALTRLPFLASGMRFGRAGGTIRPR